MVILNRIVDFFICSCYKKRYDKTVRFFICYKGFNCLTGPDFVTAWNDGEFGNLEVTKPEIS